MIQMKYSSSVSITNQFNHNKEKQRITRQRRSYSYIVRLKFRIREIYSLSSVTSHLINNTTLLMICISSIYISTAIELDVYVFINLLKVGKSKLGCVPMKREQSIFSSTILSLFVSFYTHCHDREIDNMFGWLACFKSLFSQLSIYKIKAHN